MNKIFNAINDAIDNFFIGVDYQNSCWAKFIDGCINYWSNWWKNTSLFYKPIKLLVDALDRISYHGISFIICLIFALVLF